MVSAEVLFGNLIAAFLVWGWAYLAGRYLAALLRPHPGFAGTVLLGMAYWAVVLYLFPFAHGLDVAAILALAGAIAAPSRPASPARSAHRVATWILLVGCGTFATLLLVQYVPPGMDASMHTTAARLIAQNRGLPRTHAPLLPELYFPAVNLGLPALAGIAARCGCVPAAAMLGAEQLTFSAFILACWLLLRLWVRPTAAAALAVFAVWTSRGAQETVEWGGVPTTTSVALGLFAARLLFDVARGPTYRAALPLGITIASLPLVHGVGAGVWSYAVAPVVLAAVLLQAPRRRLVLRSLTLAALVVVLILGTYLAVGQARVSEAELKWTRNFQAGFAPQGEGWELLLAVPAYIKTFAGSGGVWPGVAAAVVLLCLRRFRVVAALAASALLLCLVVANSRVWALPLSFLLYPERAVYWATPLAAVAMALAWRSLPLQVRASASLRLALLLILVPLACVHHVHKFQRLALRPEITRQEWAALRWAEHHLDPTRAVVISSYKTAGAFLTPVAGLAATGWHVHLVLENDADAVFRRRPSTHLFLARGEERPEPLPGEVIFRNEQVLILATREPGSVAFH
jgi:hypothetical protein